MNKIIVSVIGFCLILGCSQQPQTTESALSEPQAHRSAKNIARDLFRHPRETLAFFGVKPEHTVVEIWPGQGWYTEWLAPLLKGQGKLYAANFSPDTSVAYFRKSRLAFEEKVQSNEIYSELEISTLQPGLLIDIAPVASADRVLTFRNVHNWMKMGFAQEVFDSFYVALKPGGQLGVVEHRAKSGTSLADMISSGYVTEQAVIDYATAAGFSYTASSELNANAKDTTEHPAGVWSLPPILRLGDENKAYYRGVGESDRMTLLFTKAL